MPTTHKVNAAVQAAIKTSLANMEGDEKPTMKQVADAFRKVGNLEQAIALASQPQDATVKSAQPADTTTTAAPATATEAPAPAKAKKVQPDAPEGWLPGESREGFVRYARRLKANGQPVSAFRTAAAKTPEQVAIVDAFRAQGVEGTFVVHNHTTGVSQAFEKWADAYAFSCTMFSPELARSVVVSIGGDPGLERLSNLTGVEVRRRIMAIIAEDEAEEEVSA